MKIMVSFKCFVEIVKFEKNYRGNIEISTGGAKPKKLYFMVLNPYDGASAEFALYEDEERQEPYAEGLGISKQGYNPRTGKNITYYDFSLDINDRKFGVVFVVSQIISEAVYRIEEMSPLTAFEFENRIEKVSTSETELAFKSFLSAFNTK